uniref:Mut7-C ubiquitin n=1 Tax=Candidatus Kentrum sp. FM TaxID=2126340 RepID=A0A450SZN5_9GAMM|nr:MAG: Mut7-C ubiquitin [Candidatus Kentron sp. FM]VFJ59620.1 MAG: Mut7-C ubiquitin [Candidatus Kentron sp. FM]VFK12011.1 MAG: Mut7-C ubiquitin [Candidatus Kentron sp. FM]
MSVRIKLKLFASLGQYLPPSARQNTVDLDMPEGMTIAAVLDGVGVPCKSVKLVFIDGVHQFPEDLDYRVLESGETLAVWPPVAGG